MNIGSVTLNFRDYATAEASYSKVLARDPDPLSRNELQGLIDAGDERELARRFAGRLEFGTAGLRGMVGAGPAMMNRLVIRETSAGLGAYLLHEVANDQPEKSQWSKGAFQKAANIGSRQMHEIAPAYDG